MINESVIVAIEGSHGTGKTTLAYALAARLSSQGRTVNVVGEVVRSSRWFQEALLHGDGKVDLMAFEHLFADQLRREMEGTVGNSFTLLDRTVLSCLGYWNLRIHANETSNEVREVLEHFASLYVPNYDLLVYSHDMYPLDNNTDPFRDSDDEFRRLSDLDIQGVIQRVGATPAEMPQGLPVSAKVDWIEERLSLASLGTN